MTAKWIVGATDEVLAFALLNEGQKKPTPKLMIMDSSKGKGVFGFYVKGYFVARESVDRDPGYDVKVFTVPSKSRTKWTITETNKGFLAFRKNGQIKMFIHDDGDVWGAEAKGYFVARENASRDAGSDVKVLLKLRQWTISVTDKGLLAFRKNGQTKMFIHHDGDVWGAFAKGYFMKTPKATPSPPVVDLTAAVVGGAIGAAGNWASGAVDDVGGFVSGTANTAKDAVEDAIGFISTPPQIFNPSKW